MGDAGKFDLDRRLEAYFATLRSPSLKEALKRNAGNWQIYAAVTTSALAMVTGASASTIGDGGPNIAAAPAASARDAKRNPASSWNMPVIDGVRLAMAKANSGEGASHAGGVEAAAIASQAQAPSILPGGVVPLDSSVSTIQPGEWVSIYGTNLAGATALWNGDFPTSLGGTRVEINGKPAYLYFVSPGQINLQAPDDTATGTVSVVVTTAAGTATSTVTLSRFAPSFSLFGTKYVSGIILRSNGSGAYGKGTYDILGPTGNSLGYPTVAARPGDDVELFAVGFGPTTPAVLAGEPFSGAAPTNDPVALYIANVPVRPTFVGLSSAGLYQINLRVPANLGQGDVPIQATVGGMLTQSGVLFPMEGGTNIITTTGGTGGGGTPGTFFTSGGGTGGGGSGGGTGGGSIRRAKKKKHYEPRLRFAE